MRPIKFRAWNLATKQLFVPHSIENPIPQPLGEHTGTIYQQFTGLHDKNGKAIYEGDVVKREWSDGSLKQQFEVFWSESKCGWNLSPELLIARSEGTDGTFAQGFEVIGNIYENPELLQKGPQK